MESNEVERTTVYEWDNPSRDLSKYRWYNPVLWLLFAVEIVILVRWYVWHKRRSWKASRQTLHSHVVFGLQQCDFVLANDDVPDHQKRNIRETREHLEKIADELDLKSDHLNRYIEPVDGEETGNTND